jgi:hypothetical protein
MWSLCGMLYVTGSAAVGTEASHSLLVVLTKWFSLPRLETRTKESNICASTGVVNSRAQ